MSGLLCPDWNVVCCCNIVTCSLHRLTWKNTETWPTSSSYSKKSTELSRTVSGWDLFHTAGYLTDWADWALSTDRSQRGKFYWPMSKHYCWPPSERLPTTERTITDYWGNTYQPHSENLPSIERTLANHSLNTDQALSEHLPITHWLLPDTYWRLTEYVPNAYWQPADHSLVCSSELILTNWTLTENSLNTSRLLSEYSSTTNQRHPNQHLSKLNIDRTFIDYSTECANRSAPFNPFTPESDQCQNSPAPSQEVWHHTVWRTWLFIANSDEKWLY